MSHEQIRHEWQEFLSASSKAIQNSDEPSHAIEDSYPENVEEKHYFSELDEPTGLMSGLVRMATNSFQIMCDDFDVVYNPSVFIEHRDGKFHMGLAGALFITRSDTAGPLDFIEKGVECLKFDDLNDRGTHICLGLQMLELGQYTDAANHFKLNDDAKDNMNDFVSADSPFHRFTVLSNLMAENGV